MPNRRPRLALPFTVLTAPDTVRLVAGEDQRYTLTGAGLELWLPELLARCRGRETLATLLTMLPEERRAEAAALVRRLYAERVLVDGPGSAWRRPRNYGCAILGQGALADRLRRALTPDAGSPRIVMFCQNDLNYAAALQAQREARQANDAWLWASTGAVNRAYVGPLMLPDAGPCFACLLRAFQRLSPAPELYDALLDHGRDSKPFASVDFPEEGIDILHGLVRWKLAQADLDQPSAALFRLHVLELGTFEIGAHLVLIDPECPECRGGRR